MLKSRPNLLMFALACLALGSGCEPEIGDECSTATECSQEGERLCLTEAEQGFPDGYCTLFNCKPGGCPEEAVCVGYRTHLSGAAECQNPFERPRLQRSFCMRSCSSHADCRSGYSCVDVGGDNPWGAEVLESGAAGGRVCAIAYRGPELPEEHEAEVCVAQSADAGQLFTPLPKDGGTFPGDGGTPGRVDAGNQDSSAAVDTGPNADAAPDADASSVTDASSATDASPR